MARYFIDRPIFAWVIAIILMLAGGLAIRSLPIAQFPAIAPPAVSITATYPGADAQTLENTTTQIIEQQMKGIDNLRYFSSSSSSAGTVTITLTFEQGTDPDIAQVQVQNKLQAATALLPQEVQQQGILVAKATQNFLLFVGLYSEDGTHNGDDLSDYIVSKLQDPLARVNGVGDTQIFGSQYAMRIWIDPLKLNNYALTITDIRTAVTAQNAQVAAGQIGAQPAPKEQMLNATVSVESRLTTPEQFAAIRLKSAPDGSVVRLGDVARVEIGAENYGFSSKWNGKPASGIGIKLAPGANALSTVTAVKARVNEIAKQFPPDVKVIFPYDTSPFVRLSIEQVVETLVEAVALVFLVMFLFLQNWRATLIPTIAVPIVLLGTFAVMAIAGYSINTLTLFGMVLAIGLLVDDAIVVVENVERLIQTEGLSPKEAARKSMDEISGALIGIGLVLSAVFLPMAFFGGSTGVIYRQFSITIVSAMVLSVMVALILTPALCATILKPHDPDRREGNGPLARFFRWFNDRFERGRDRYENGVKRTARSWKRSLLVYALIVLGMGFLFFRLPTGFLPEEDQGIMIALVQGPSGATSARTEKGLDAVREHFLSQEGANVQGVFTVNGFSFAGTGQNSGIAFIPLKEWSERSGAANKAQAMAGRAMGAFSQFKDALIFAVVPPAVQELGNATGFDLQLVDQTGVGHAKLLEARNMMLGMAAQNKQLAGVRPNALDDAPQLKVEVDQDKARALGLDLSEVNTTISTAWGGAYINDFIDRGRVKRVYMQADQPYRLAPEDIGNIFVRGATGTMAPFTAFSTLSWSQAPVQLTRYNGQPAMELLGAPAPGVSSGVAMQAMEDIHAKMPPGIGLEWTGLSFEERLSGGQAPALYALSLLIVFLCLAALYESWSVPISVLLVVPLGVLGALLAATLTGLNNDIYLQVGLITTIGVSAKNAILIVEFAEERMRDGMNAFDAVVEAAKLRLRPILMTSLAFIFGVLPLALSTGAGAGGQNAIGRAVVGGMLSATILAIFFVPMFFVVVLRLFGRHKDDSAANRDADTAPQEPDVTKSFRLSIVLMTSATLAGCNLAPKYVRPVGAVPAELPQGGPYPRAATDAPDITAIGWRDFFTDPRLVQVIDAGLANNRDARIAAANVLQARAQYRVQRADLVPTTTVSGSGTYTNNAFGSTGGAAGGAGTGAGGGTGVGAGSGVGSTSSNLEFYSVNAGFSAFELDLFGRTRNLTRAAQEQFFASEEAQRSTRISLIAEIATAWLTMASDQDQLRLSRNTLKAFEKTLELTRAQFRVGVASELAARQAETTYQQARGDIAALESRIAQDQNALNLLVGTTITADQLPTGLGTAGYARDNLPGNISSEVLLRRPDVLQAEHQLIAENANIGAARAAFFPTISLTATIGTISTALSGLFGGGSFTYNGAPGISLPLFDGGRNAGNLEYAKATQQVAVATYEKAIQTAFREVADALATRGTIDEQVAAQAARVNAADIASRLSDARYRAGIDSFLTALDAQRTAYAAQQQLQTTRLARASNLVEVYRTLGGGLN